MCFVSALSAASSLISTYSIRCVGLLLSLKPALFDSADERSAHTTRVIQRMHLWSGLTVNMDA